MSSFLVQLLLVITFYLSCIRNFTSSSGYIATPNYGKKYPPLSACKWTIKTAVGTVISLYFRTFYLEKSGGCRGDYLFLFDGGSSSAPKVGRYCVTAPRGFTSSSNFVHLEFYSDHAVNYKGFLLYYNSTMPATAKPSSWQSLPKFLNVHLNVTATEGNKVTLICEVDGTPVPRITWKRGSQTLTQDDRIVIKDSSLSSVVTIKDVRKTDQGSFTCTANNGVGSPVESHGFLAVKSRDIPFIKKTTENKTVTVGTVLKLNCEATGSFPLTISWKTKDSKLASKQCDVSSDCKLKFKKKIGQDSVLTCQVVNNIGSMSKNVSIKVKGPPLIIKQPKDKTAEPGGLVNFTCVAIGKQPLRISWEEKGETTFESIETIEDRSVLTVSAKKNTTLTCIVDSQGGRATEKAQLIIKENTNSEIKIYLKFTTIPKNLTVEYNESVDLQCKAAGDPEPQISWYQGKQLVAKGTTLRLESLEKTLNVYCIAKNSHQERKASATITVLPGPTISKTKTSGSFDDNMKLIIGAGVGVLLLTAIIIIFLLVRRRKRNKKMANDSSRLAETTKENENLIPNPLFSQSTGEDATKPGVEMLHYPREAIIHCEDIDVGMFVPKEQEPTEVENRPAKARTIFDYLRTVEAKCLGCRDIATKDDNVQMFLGRASDLPFASGEYKVVVKVLKGNEPSAEKKKEFDVEAALLANLVHPNVIRLMAVCIKAPPLCLVFEYSQYGYLDEYLQDCDPSDFTKIGKRKTNAVRDSFTELANVDRLSIAKQIASGMQYLTEKGYIHQELRARNCMVFKDMQVKVANLGLQWAKPEQNFFVMEPAEKKRFPVRWLPPEAILYGEYSESADVWSYGVLVWEVFSDGQLPYTGINDNDVVSYVRGYNILPRPKACPHNVYDVLKSCWEMAPLERPNFPSLYETMSTLHAGVPV